MYSLFLYLLFSSSYIFGYSLSELPIQHVHIIFRHGDRSPIYGLLSPDEEFSKLWPSGRGQLTQHGILQEFELGKWLRSKYKSFVPNDYNASDFHMRSTDVDRTLMSAQAVLAGFYHNSTSPLSKFGLQWVPIPVHTVREENDLLLSTAPCPRLKQLQKLQMDSPESVQFEAKYSNLMNYLQQHITHQKVNRFNVWHVSDAVTCMMANGYKLPSWINSTVVDQLNVIEKFYWDKQFTSTPAIVRLEIGVFLHKFVDHVLAITQNVRSVLLQEASTNHVLAYSAHDLDISYLLTAWNLNKGQLPISYAASLMIELLGPHPPSPITTYRLRFRYKSGWEDVSGKFLQLPSCPDIPAEEGCALTSALDQIDPYLLDDDKFFRECSMSGGSRRLRDSADCPVITSSSSATEGTQIRLKETHIMIIVVSSIFALCVISVSVAVAIRRTRDEIPFEQLL